MPPSFSSADSPGNERERWNQKYRDKAGSACKAPDPFLPWCFSKYILPSFPNGGIALDLAGGAGRQAIWLATQGWEVTLIDISETGVDQARHQAGPLATQIHFVVDDLTHFKAAQTRFDILLGFYFLERQIFPELLNAIRPGGLLIYKTYTTALLKRPDGLKADAPKPDGPRNEAYLLKPGELLKLAAGLKVLHYKEVEDDTATAEIVAEIQPRDTVRPI
jgi:2-polyprenyl-3-methyl-5-hydroxy-6-metoxy-1,4-benzoquinol methylase